MLFIIYETFHLTLVKKNRQNRESRKRSDYRKKPSSDWLEKDQWESVISVQSLAVHEFFLLTEGEIRSFDKSDFKTR